MPFIIFLLACAVFAQSTSEFMLAGLLQPIAADLDITLPQASALTSAFAAGMAIGAPSVAAVSRRWSPRLALSTLLALFIMLHVIGAMSDSFAVLLLTRVGAALTSAGFLAVTLATVTALVPAHRIARALAVVLGGTTLALIVGVPAGAAVGAALSWRATLWGVALLSLPALLAVLTLAPRRTSGAAPLTPLRREFAALRRSTLTVPLGACALVNGATFCAFTYLAPVATEIAGLPTTTVPVVLALFGIGAFGGVAAAGRWGDVHARRVLAVGGIALFFGWAILASFAAIPAVLLLLAFAQGALSFAVGSTLIAASLRAAPDAPTMAGAFGTAALNIGAMTGPLLGGIAYASAGGAQGPLVMSCAFTLAAALLSVTQLRRPRPRVSFPG
ncbi:DHA1 family chloramphenicol resistance protein-like MFS transporter [Leucobacter luti]|uniref:Cmx/CmrA family chloramphenicol efflux MFS transporter n=1 Tax=Leucobacter luti TaxID=340320 RepID=UPI0010457FC9|nr:Cmx/CmrA family chloramphenicol efflux MFS transporter [Leucobacter luti]MCW2289247.1 DHA1 family chloramphenicol resistance protein-like MFS transporter [Leucobacter luti]TCK39810.1 DHA1 family chloramphenicol resistance protein-like MFS transporter [Leucobacter luti]